MNHKNEFNLKLLGKNLEDLKVISAYMQDSITKVKDIVFLQQNRTLVMIANRFMWEDLEKGLLRKNKRIKCAIKFEEVIKVISKNINKKYENRPIECLAIESNLTENNNYNINIFFLAEVLL